MTQNRIDPDAELWEGDFHDGGKLICIIDAERFLAEAFPKNTTVTATIVDLDGLIVTNKQISIAMKDLIPLRSIQELIDASFVDPLDSQKPQFDDERVDQFVQEGQLSPGEGKVVKAWINMTLNEAWQAIAQD